MLLNPPLPLLLATLAATLAATLTTALATAGTFAFDTCFLPPLLEWGSV
jgi:hypothetical protein